jgi:hypothetical protein
MHVLDGRDPIVMSGPLDKHPVVSANVLPEVSAHKYRLVRVTTKTSTARKGDR